MTDPLDVAVRAATSTDVGDLVEFYRASNADTMGERGAELHYLLRGRFDPVEDSFSANISAEATHVFVGLLDGVSVGYAVTHIDELRNGERLARISDLFVLPAARKVGVGEALFGTIVELAESADCRGIDAVALPGDRETKNFFESFGLVARAIEVHRSL